jgi:hypothetical protein
MHLVGHAVAASHKLSGFAVALLRSRGDILALSDLVEKYWRFIDVV